MKYYTFLCALALTLCAPAYAHGQVVINEIAWMGTAVSATDEWIELFNTSSEDISLAGWKLAADDGAPSISLSGSVPAGGYYLLERTDDTTVPDVTADKIYSGDLGNAGETLQLFDGQGIIVDTAAGGSDWKSLGGYNTTKDTPQRQADGTWLTGVPTPKAINTTVASAPPDDGAGTSTSKTSTPRKRIITGGYKQVVFGYAGEDVTGVVGAALRFEGYAVSDKNSLLRSAEYFWSFGDGGKEKGKEVSHIYEEPGTYTVTLRVESGHQKWKDMIIVTILPADVTLVERHEGERGYVEIRNDSDVPLDLSLWQLSVSYARKRLRDAKFIMPEATIIAPHTSVKFPSRVTGLTFADEDTVSLQYPSGAVAATHASSIAAAQLSGDAAATSTTATATSTLATP